MLAGVIATVLTIAFEFQPAGGAADALLASGTGDDWRSQFPGNPALGVVVPGCATALAYCRPYGLAGVDWGRASAGLTRGAWSGGLSLSTLSFAGYRESDCQANLAARCTPEVAVGFGLHWYSIAAEGSREGLPGFDAGLCWRTGRFQAGLAVLRANSPMCGGAALSPVVVVAGAVRPADDVGILLDVRRTDGPISLLLGAEFDVADEIRFRAGVGTRPLNYAAGLRLALGSLALDYSCRFHPALTDAHVLGLEVSWR